MIDWTKEIEYQAKDDVWVPAERVYVSTGGDPYPHLIVYRDPGDGLSLSDWVDEEEGEIRNVPTVRYEPWTFETCPIGNVLIRPRIDRPDVVYMLATKDQIGVFLCGLSGSRSYAELSEHYEASLDGGATWQPAGREVRE
jgi:hypothetical protein